MIKCPITITSIENVCGTNLGGISSVAIGNFGAYSFEYDYQIIDTKTATEYQSLSETEKAKYEAEGDNYIQYAKDIDGNKIKASIKSATVEQGANKMKFFNFKAQTANFNQSLNYSENGANFWTQTISLVFAKQDSAKRLSIMSLMQGECVAVVTDSNKHKFLVGLNYPLYMTEGTADSGTAFTDNNAYTISLSCSDLELALPISDDAYTAIVE